MAKGKYQIIKEHNMQEPAYLSYTNKRKTAYTYSTDLVKDCQKVRCKAKWTECSERCVHSYKISHRGSG